MNDKLIVDLIAAVSGLNKTLLIQHQSKANTPDPEAGSRRRDKETVTIKFDDAALKQLKGLVGNWHAPVKGGSPSAGTEANRRLTGSVNNLNKSTVQLTKSFDDLEESVDDVADSFDRLLRVNTENFRQHQRTIAGHAQFRQELGKLIASTKSFNDAMRSAPTGGGGGGTGKSNDKKSSDSPGGNSITDSLAKAMTELGFKVGTLMSGVVGYVSDTTYAMKTGSQFKFIDTPIDAAKMGLSSQEFLQLGATYRSQAMRLADGTNGWMAAIKSSQRDLVAFTGGDMLKAAEISSTMNARLMDMGFSLDEATKMIGRGDNGYIGALKKLTYATGKTVEELDGFIGNILSSDNVRSGLFKMDREQRKGYLSSQTQLFQRMFEITGSIDRAKQIMESMNNRQGMTGLERVRDAAKASVAARALGLSGSESNELMKLRTSRPESLTAKQNERLAELNNKMSRNAEGMVGSGDLYREMFAQVVTSKTGQDMKQLQVYNTSLDQPTNLNTLEGQIASSMTKAFDNPQMQEMLAVLEIIKKSLGSNLASIVIGGFASVVGLMASRGLFQGAGLKGLFSKGGTGTSGGLGGIGGASSSGKLLGRVARGGVAGLAGWAGMAALDTVWEPTTPTEQLTKGNVMDYGQGAVVGAALGSMVAPIVGTAIGSILGMAYVHFTRDVSQNKIKLSAAEQQELAQLAQLQKETVQRKHAFEMDNIQAFTRTMTANELEMFNRGISNIEANHGVKIKSINDISKFENNELNDFINQRKKMLQESHTAEMKYIDKKQEMLKIEYDRLSGVSNNMDRAERVANASSDLATWLGFGNSISPTKLSKVATEFNPGADAQRTLYNTFAEMNPSMKNEFGWTDSDMVALFDAMAKNSDIDKESKLGTLAQTLANQMTLKAQSEAKQSQIDFDKTQSMSTLITGMSNLTQAQKSQSIEHVFGDVLDRTIQTMSRRDGIDYASQKGDIINDITQRGYSAFPEINSALNAHALSMPTSFGRMFAGTNYSSLANMVPPTTAKPESAPGSLIMRQDDTQVQRSESSDSKKVETVIVFDPKLIQELQKQTMLSEESIKAIRDMGDKTQQTVNRNTYRQAYGK